MRIWTVHLPTAATRPGRRAAQAVLVPEAFAWGAALLPLPWLLWHRLWWEAVAWTGAALLLAALWGPGWGPAALLAGQFLLGATAQDVRRAALGRRGWRLAQVVAAPDEDQALGRLLEARPEWAPLFARAVLA